MAEKRLRKTINYFKLKYFFFFFAFFSSIFWGKRWFYVRGLQKIFFETIQPFYNILIYQMTPKELIVFKSSAMKNI